MKHRSIVMALAVLLGGAGLANAQTTVINPTRVEFVASADHNLAVGGVPVVTNYELEVMAGSPTGALAFTVGLGKPTPDANNIISAPVPNFLTMPTNTLFVATVSAVWAGGLATSLPSDPFARMGKPANPGKPVPK